MSSLPNRNALANKPSVFLIIISLPVQLEAVGSVTVQEEALLLISQFSAMPTVKSAVLVTGAPRPRAPVIVTKPLLPIRIRSLRGLVVPVVTVAN